MARCENGFAYSARVMKCRAVTLGGIMPKKPIDKGCVGGPARQTAFCMVFALALVLARPLACYADQSTTGEDLPATSETLADAPQPMGDQMESETGSDTSEPADSNGAGTEIEEPASQECPVVSSETTFDSQESMSGNGETEAASAAEDSTDDHEQGESTEAKSQPNEGADGDDGEGVEMIGRQEGENETSPDDQLGDGQNTPSDDVPNSDDLATGSTGQANDAPAPQIASSSAPSESSEGMRETPRSTPQEKEAKSAATATSAQPKAGVYVLRWTPRARMVLDIKSGKLVTATVSSSKAQRFVLKKSSKGWIITSAHDGKYIGAKGASGSAAPLTSTASDWLFECLDGYWLIRSASTSLLLGSAGDASGVGMYKQQGTTLSNALWELVAAPSLDGEKDAPKAGYYRLVSSSGKRMDVRGASNKAGTSIIVYGSSAGANQIFKVEVTNQGFVRLRAGNTNKVVTAGGDILSKGGGVTLQKAQDTALNQLFRCKRTKNGSWELYDLATGTRLGLSNTQVTSGKSGAWSLRSANNFAPQGLREIGLFRASAMRLDVRRESLKSGASILQWGRNGGQNQKWDIVRVATNAYTIQNVRSGLYLGKDKSGNAIQSKTPTRFTIIPLINSWGLRIADTNSGLTVPDASSKQGAALQFSNANWGDGQCFNIRWTSPVEDGVYAIELKANRNSVVGVVSSSDQNAKNVKTLWWKGQQRTAAGNQKWRFCRNSDGTYTIINSYSCKALDAAHTKPKNGSNVAQWTNKNGKNQRWWLVYNHDGSFKIVNAANSSVVLTAETTATNKNVSVADNKGTSNQRFAFKKAAYLTGDAELDGIIEGMVGRCGTGEKGLRKAYDEIAAYPYVGMNVYPKGSWRTWSIAYAKEFYKNKSGNCYRYNSLMCWYARAIGYESRTISGKIWLGDHWAAHGWAEIKVNGQTLILDPRQGGHRNRKYGEDFYRCFLCTYKTNPDKAHTTYPYRTKIVTYR